MKQYFAKYLPVEGEIPIGSLMFFKIGGEWTRPANFDDYLGVGIEEVKLAKLFLCSRDIQVGDNVYNTAQETYFKANQELVDMLNDPNVEITTNIKVIGEISPEATWVKEGDEFDDEDINIWAWDGEDEWNFSIEEWLLEEQEHSYEDSKIEIKGPCGHFH